MEAVQQMQARLDALTSDRNLDDGDVSETEVEATEEEVIEITSEMRFFHSVLISTATATPQGLACFTITQAG